MSTKITLSEPPVARGVAGFDALTKQPKLSEKKHGMRAKDTRASAAWRAWAETHAPFTAQVRNFWLYVDRIGEASTTPSEALAQSRAANHLKSLLLMSKTRKPRLYRDKSIYIEEYARQPDHWSQGTLLFGAFVRAEITEILREGMAKKRTRAKIKRSVLVFANSIRKPLQAQIAASNTKRVSGGK